MNEVDRIELDFLKKKTDRDKVVMSATDVSKLFEAIRKKDAQNKLMYQALMCMPGAMGATVTQEVCKICVNGCKCNGCVIDEAIREAMDR